MWKEMILEFLVIPEFIVTILVTILEFLVIPEFLVTILVMIL